MLAERTASQLVGEAAEIIQAGIDDFSGALDAIDAPIYVTDKDGTITYYNKACITLAGRRPRVGVDKWCVTWKIFTLEGEFLPHDECPMAVAIKERKAVRDVEAVAERPDGTRVNFVPYPTPLFDAEGNLCGAVYLLLDVTDQRKPEYLKAQAAQCRNLALCVNDRQAAESLHLLAAKYDLQAGRLSN
ncbi:MAG: PAS domain-containing protein [Croceibacterium sp.]